MNNPFESLADPAGTLKRAKEAREAAKPFSIDALKVEEGIPFVARCQPDGKWEPLFLKLEKPGQSIELPRALKSSVAAAALVRAKKNKAGTFKVAITGSKTCRIWRIK